MKKYLSNFIYLALISIISLFFLIFFIFYFFGKDLPSFDKLSSYQPRLVSKIFTSNGNFLEDYSNENRVFSSYNEIPKELINCFLVSEDINFYSHIGIDYRGIMRAFLKNIKKTFSNKRPEGASTITQQVAKNFLLSNEISYTRKIKEIIIALRMEKVLEKEQIMELYLNEIYLGNGSYGIASASLNYFNKSLPDLELHEMAMLAALPKAPSTYNPYKNPIKALKRRNWVLKRLLDEKFIKVDEFNSIINKQLKLSKSEKILTKDDASFFKEEVRREIIAKFNESKLYEGGLAIMTTLNEEYQMKAEEAFRKGLRDYANRSGYKGPITNIKITDEWEEKFRSLEIPAGIYDNEIGIVKRIKNDHILVRTRDSKEFQLFEHQLSIIKKKKINLKKEFKIGDVIVLKTNSSDFYELSQIPKVNGAMVVIENLTGRVLAMVGGYDSSSSFNRAVQAKRQLGSSFKPFVYITALENGYTPVSKILDAPFVIDDLSKDGVWRPTNYGDKFYGPSTLRLGIEKSRNLMTIRLSDKIGLDKLSKLSKDLEIYEDFPLLISSSLGSLESSLIKITSGYASIANGGYKVNARLIDAIYDNRGKVIYKGDTSLCKYCNLETDENLELNLEPLPIKQKREEQIFSSESAYQMTSFLMGVIERGTAKNINSFEFEVAGKTGTTNENQDAWFVGYNSEITVGVFVGFDVPKSLGRFETGSRVAAPIFEDFLHKVYKNKKPKPFDIPDSIKFINIDLFSGEPTTKNFITESFKNDFNFEKNFIGSDDDKDFQLRGFY